MYSIKVICPLGLHGHGHGCDMGSQNLADVRTLQPLANSLQIKFIWTILACGCAISESFAYRGYMGKPTSIVRNPQFLRTFWLHNQTISTQCADEILLELDEFYAEIEIIVKNLRK